MKTERRIRRSGKERGFEGVGVSSGIALGTAHLVETGAVHIPEYEISASQVEEEQARFAKAVATAQKQIRKLGAKAAGLHGAAAEEIAILLEAHLQMLSGSRVLRGVEHRIARDRINAEAAVQAEISDVAQEFAALDDPYIAARADDVREVGDRLIRNLTKTPFAAFSHLPEGTIIVAEDLTPADTALMDPAMIAGFTTLLGGAESHTAIMARSLGLPAVLGVAGLLGAIKSGDSLIIDGDEGRVIVRPSAETLAEYRRRLGAHQRDLRSLARLSRLPAVTRDGTEIALYANLELPRELGVALQAGAQGVGLLRTEFMFMNRDSLPDEEEQYRALRGLLEGLDGKPMTARTLDVGGDKLAQALAGHHAGAANPALGLRAIRLSLKERSLLDAQLGAMLRAAAHGPLRILLPMISSLSEIRQVRDAMQNLARRLKRRGHAVPDPLPPLGVMIEVPGAALAADALAQEVDFFAIGSN
ncbi:MAG TPA: phosphoenolpyruvate--protein phosphotransferase, partial [Dongiaceae bacterium]|nr:phosphoenolpyruvate--protein phosphotransferase [Dongiaceae bacterium]